MRSCLGSWRSRVMAYSPHLRWFSIWEGSCTCHFSSKYIPMTIVSQNMEMRKWPSWPKVGTSGSKNMCRTQYEECATAILQSCSITDALHQLEIFLHNCCGNWNAIFNLWRFYLYTTRLSQKLVNEHQFLSIMWITTLRCSRSVRPLVRRLLACWSELMHKLSLQALRTCCSPARKKAEEIVNADITRPTTRPHIETSFSAAHLSTKKVRRL